MKTRPILFSGPMVKALLAGTKTQTRRVVKAPKCATVHERVSYPEKSRADTSLVRPDSNNLFGVRNDYLHWAYGGGDIGDDVLKARVFCPYGEPGDRLWVRESFCGPILMREGPRLFYAATDERQTLPGGKPVKWKPSIFMRPTESRITLEIATVRVDRLQSITEDDARAEGVDTMNIPARINGELGEMFCFGPEAHRNAYRLLWDAINKTKPWATNPWVWVVEFRKVT